MMSKRLYGKCVRRYASMSAAGKTVFVEMKTPPIKIAPRINRKPTDILKTLASTVKEDPTGQAYVFVDDPLFTPIQVHEARNFALSKELGRKAARYFASEYPTLFMYDQDEPRLSAFRPTAKPRTESADDEATLNDRIDRILVRASMTVYQNAVARKRPISDKTTLKLLELLTFFNHDDAADMYDTSLETWHRHLLNAPPKTAWKDNCLAMKIYNSMPEPKDVRATAAIICGMTKYFAVEKGYEMWQKTRTEAGRQKIVDARVYATLLKYGVEKLKAVNAERWELVVEFFKAMTEDGVKPTLAVFNAAFGILTKASKWKRTEELAQKLFQEMLASGIQPSLGTYGCILRIFSKRPSLASVMDAVLTRLEQSQLKLYDELDQYFFVEAMRLCCEELRDRDAALRLHRILKTGDNYLVVTDTVQELNYYRALLFLLSVTEDTKTFFEKYYSRMVPRYYTPNTHMFEAILQNVESSSAYEYLPRVCQDLLLYGFWYRRNDLWAFLSTALRAPVSELSPETKRNFARMAQDVYERIERQYAVAKQRKEFKKLKEGEEILPPAAKEEEVKNDEEGDENDGAPTKNERQKTVRQKEKKKDEIRLEWTADVMASLAILCARGGDFDKAWTMYKRVVPSDVPTDQDVVILGEVPHDIAVEMLEKCVERKQYLECKAALSVLARGKNAKLTTKYAEMIKNKLPLNAVQTASIEKYIKNDTEKTTNQRE